MVIKKKSIFLSIVELHFSLTTIHPTVGVKQRRLFMMFLVHQVLMTAESIRVVDSLNWKNGRSLITAVQMSYSLTDNNYLSPRRLFCDICHKNCISPADFVLHQERVHLCLPLFVCPICHFTYITRSCLRMHITESHGGPATASSLI